MELQIVASKTNHYNDLLSYDLVLTVINVQYGAPVIRILKGNEKEFELARVRVFGVDLKN